MSYEFPPDIRKYLEKNPAFINYLQKNREGKRYVRCEFPQLMGGNTLTRPDWLLRSVKYPYFDKPYGIQARAQERLVRPHVNRVKSYRDSDEMFSLLKKAEIEMDEKPYEKKAWGEIRIGTWKKNGNIRVLVKIFDKTKPEWTQEEQLLALETCKSESIGHINFFHYYGSLESRMVKYHVFEHMSRGNLLQVLRADGALGASSNASRPVSAVSGKSSKDEVSTIPLDDIDSVASTIESLSTIRKRVILTDEIKRKMFCQILFAISHIHDKDMVHR